MLRYVHQMLRFKVCVHTEQDKNRLVGVEGDFLQSHSHQLLHWLLVPALRYRLALHLRLLHQRAHKHISTTCRPS